MAVVLITRPLPVGGDEPLLTAGHDLIKPQSDAGFAPAELRQLVRDADAMVTTLSDRIDDEALSASHGRLRVVANVAVGYDNVDLQSARRNGIVVCNTPGVLDEATADVAFLLLLAAARGATAAEADLRAGRWGGWQLTQYLGQEVYGQTLGLVGYGRIGQALARRAAGFGLDVIHHTRHDTGLAGWIPSLDELLARSDFVSLHVPLSPASHHLIDAVRLKRMKPTAVLVNTSRGAIIDERALASALHEGVIFAAGLDVYEREPQVSADLLTAPRAVLLPHIGSATELTRRRMATMACQAVVDVLVGRRPQHPVMVPAPPSGGGGTSLLSSNGR
jgi:glyoxylate reductase